MLQQLIKMMWHRKGKNFLLLIEIFFSFLVLFATLTLAINQLRNYYTPTGFDYKDVYVVEIDQHGEKGTSLREKVFQIKNLLRSMPEINSHSLSSSNVPYAFSTNSTRCYFDGQSIKTNIYNIEPEYFQTMDLDLVSGRFLQEGDEGEIPSVVINETFAKELFKEENPQGKVVTNLEGQANGKVVGVVKHFRQDGEYAKPLPAVFHLVNLHDTAGWFPSTLLIEAKAGAAPGWQQQLLDNSSAIAPDWNFEEESMADKKETKAKVTLVPLIALGIVGGFLVFNVILGLFGVLWYNISKRFSEIGIRRALGATQPAIRRQMVGEVLVLATFGLVLGLIMAVQFPMLGVFDVENSVYTLAILLSLVLVYLLVALCAWYPSRQAAAIEPANALHYE
jgi:putative ABC transport system permease protein